MDDFKFGHIEFKIQNPSKPIIVKLGELRKTVPYSELGLTLTDNMTPNTSAKTFWK